MLFPLGRCASSSACPDRGSPHPKVTLHVGLHCSPFPLGVVREEQLPMTVHCHPSCLTNWKTNEIISSSVLCRQEVVLQLSASSILIAMANRTNSLECPQPATGTKARILWLLQRAEVTFSNKYNKATNSILWCAEHWNNPTQKSQRPLWLF